MRDERLRALRQRFYMRNGGWGEPGTVLVHGVADPVALGVCDEGRGSGYGLFLSGLLAGATGNGA